MSIPSHAAAADAQAAAQLLLYWYGIPDPETGMNLASCIWQSRKHALKANSQPHHAIAMRLAATSYEVYSCVSGPATMPQPLTQCHRLERHVLRKEQGSTHVTIEPYIQGTQVGW